MKKYVDKDALQEFTTKLTNKYKTLFSSPLVASTAADMTDTEKVYVYVGSETGYTSGNWYYYDGSAWQSGGVYNAVAVETDTTLSVSGKAADAAVVGDNIGAFKYSQTKAARIMTVPVASASGDVYYFKPLVWTGDSFTQITVQGNSGGTYTTLARIYALNDEITFTVSASYDSFLVAVSTAAVPSTAQTFSFILCKIDDLDTISSIAINNKLSFDNSRYKFRGYTSATANINTIVEEGWYLIADSRIATSTGLPDDMSGNAILKVYPGNLTIQTIDEISYPFNKYQRYLYSNNTQQSAWIKTPNYYRPKTAYIFGDSLTVGTLGGGGTGTSYLEQAALRDGYAVVNCGVGGIGYVYSAKKLMSEVQWNTSEGRIRAQDVIEHYANDLINADTVILAYGVNDWQTLGDASVTITETDRRATSANITANVKTAIETIMSAHAGARIIVITPINTSYRGGNVASGYALNTALDNNGDGKEAMTLEKTYQAIVDACDYYGVDYIDMTHNNAAVTYLNITGVLPDGLHPSQTTYNRLADSIRL